jgi:apurinic endonuclease APN1
MLGSNVPTVGGLGQGLVWGETWGCDAIQVYVTPSRTWSVPELDPGFAASFRESLATSPIGAVVAHIPFLVNLASPSEAHRVRSTARLVTEIERCGQLGVAYAVLHPGSSMGSDRSQSLDALAQALTSALEQTSGVVLRVCLETMSGQGSTLGSTFEELARVLEMVADERLGVCLDIAHVYQAGYDVSGPDGYDRVISELQTRVGLHRLGVVHCNDSATPLGSRRDLHASPGHGHIGVGTFWSLVRDGRLAETPCILELPDRDGSAVALDYLRTLRELDEPPAEDVGWCQQMAMEV